MEISNNGLITWVPEEIGNYDVEVKVSDGKYFDTQSYTINVIKDGEQPRDSINHVHKFTLSNVFIEYDDEFVYIYPMTRNQGNQRESIKMRVFNMNTGDFRQDSFNLDISQGKFNYIIMNKPSSGHYTYKIEAISNDYHDILYRSVEII